MADVPDWRLVGRHGGYLRMDVVVVVLIVIGLRFGWNGLLLEGKRWLVVVMWLPFTASAAVVDATYIFVFSNLGLSTEYSLSIYSFACTHLDLQAFLARCWLLKLLVVEERIDPLLVDVQLLRPMRLTCHRHILCHLLHLLVTFWPIVSAIRLAVSTSLPLWLCWPSGAQHIDSTSSSWFDSLDVFLLKWLRSTRLGVLSAPRSSFAQLNGITSISHHKVEVFSACLLVYFVDGHGQVDLESVQTSACALRLRLVRWLSYFIGSVLVHVRCSWWEIPIHVEMTAQPQAAVALSKTSFTSRAQYASSTWTWLLLELLPSIAAQCLKWMHIICLFYYANIKYNLLTRRYNLI